MTDRLAHSVFHEVIFPQVHNDHQDVENLVLRKRVGFTPLPTTPIQNLSLVFFDFETTGLDPHSDRIIEVGAIKFVEGRCVDEFSSLLSTDVVITDMITSITGIAPEMLAGKPQFDEIALDFINFIKGSVLVAHNAEFDLHMLKSSTQRIGIDLAWPVCCTLKMARAIMPQLERHTLDRLASHFNLEFKEGRHRAVGDTKVLLNVFCNLLELDPKEPEIFSDLSGYLVT